jgi:hypothetical protein
MVKKLMAQLGKAAHMDKLKVRAIQEEIQDKM